jgi:hypothetical protein
MLIDFVLICTEKVFSELEKVFNCKKENEDEKDDFDFSGPGSAVDRACLCLR